MKTQIHRIRRSAAICLAAIAVAITAGADPRPGLKEFRIGGRHAYDNPMPELFLMEPGRIVSAPYALNATNGYAVADCWPPDPSIGGGWAWNTTFAYSGFIHIPGTSATTRFGVACVDRKALYINGVRFEAPYWDWSIVTGRNLGEGWHEIEIWVDVEDPQRSGPIFKDGNYWHPDRIGFGVNYTDGPAITDYVFPEEPGDGSVFIADPPPGFVKVKTTGVGGILGGDAELSGYVKLGEEHPGVARVYFGTVDGEDDPGAWLRHEDHPVVIDAFGAAVAIAVSDLALGVPCYFRFAFTNDLGIIMAPNTLSFTPVDFYAPARFGWAGDRAVNAWDWNDPAGWVNLDGLSRKIPGASVGDTVFITEAPAGNRTITLTNDVTLSGITAGFNVNANNISIAHGGTNAVTINLKTPDGAPVAINDQGIDVLSFGSNSNRDLLTFNLHQSAAFNYNNSINGRLFLSARFTGGEPGGTFGFYHNRDHSYSTFRVYVRNPNNTYVGDVILGTTNPAHRPLTIYLGDSEGGGIAGEGSFGAPANRVVSNHAGNLIAVNTSGGGYVFNRVISGAGSFRCVSMQGSNAPQDTPRPLTFGPESRIELGVGDNLGTFSFYASALNFDDDSRVRVKVKADGTSDSFVAQLRGNQASPNWDGTSPNAPTPGTLNCGGEIEFAELDLIRAGTEFTFARTVYDNTVVAGKFKSATPLYRIETVNEPNGTISFVACKQPMQTTVIVR